MSQVTGPLNENIDKFVIDSISLTNKNLYTVVDSSASPDSYNFNFSAEKFTKITALQRGDFSFALDIFDPSISKNISNSEIKSFDFSGISVDLYDYNRTLVGRLEDGLRKTNFSLNTQKIKNYLNTGSGYDVHARTFFLDFNSVAADGTSDTYSVYVDYPEAQITGLEIIESNPLIVTPLTDSYNNLSNLDIFVVPNNSTLPTGSYGNFNGAETYAFANINYTNNKYPRSVNLDIPTLVSGSVEIAYPFNLVLIPSDYYSTGNYFLSSGVKTSYYTDTNIPDKIDNITGFITVDQNKYDKTLNTNAFVKWDSVKTDYNLTFETVVCEKNADKNMDYSFSANFPKIEGISSIVHGTGSGILNNFKKSSYYSGDAPVFTSYGSSGIQWNDHTLYIDNYKSFFHNFISFYI